MSIQYKSLAKWNSSSIKDAKFHKTDENSVGQMYVKIIIHEDLAHLELMNANPQDDKLEIWRIRMM